MRKAIRLISRVLPSGLRHRIRGVLWNALKLDRTLDTGVPVRVEGPDDWVMFTEIFVEGEYDLAIDTLLEHRSPPWEILDLGGNIGYFSLRFVDRALRKGRLDPDARKGFRLTVLEPSPRLHARLEDTMAQADLLKDRVRLIRGAAGRRTGHAMLEEPAFHPMNRLRSGGSGHRVDYVDLDSLFPGGGEIDMIKCDIEGSEQDFLESYPELLARTGVLVVELHPSLGVDEKRCVALLKAAGFPRIELLRREDEQGIAVYLATRT